MDNLRLRLALGAIALISTLACSERMEPPVVTPDAQVDGEVPLPDGGTRDATMDASPDATMDAMVDAAPDAMPDATPMEACEGGETYTFVLNLVDVTEEEPPGVAPGFNLDGRVSDGRDRESCGHEDFISPEGVEGIDNQLVTLLPLVEALGMIDVSASIADSVRSGGLLLLVQLDHVDSFVDDSCVDVSILNGLLPAGVTVPSVDASGRIAAGQTFDIDSMSYDGAMEPRVRVEGAGIAGGVVTAGPVDLTIPLPLGATGTLPLTARDAQLRFSVSEGRISAGLLGGGVAVTELAGAVMGLDISLPIPDITGTLQGYADLNRTMGVCQAISAAIEVEGVTAVFGSVRDF